MKFTMRQISNGWILKIVSYGQSSLKEPYDGFRKERYFQYLENAIQWIKEIRGVM